MGAFIFTISICLLYFGLMALVMWAISKGYLR